MTRTEKPIPHQRRGAGAFALALLSCAMLACRTPTRATPPMAAAQAEARDERRVGCRASDDGARQEAPTATSSDRLKTSPVLLEGPPRLLLTPSGSAYLVLRAGPEEREGAITWDVLFVAGYDATALEHPDTPDRLAAAAAEILGAYGPIAETGGLARLSTTAMFGQPGESGSVVRFTFTRDATGWKPPASGERGTARFPPLRAELARHPDEETNAREAAAAFISAIDRADYEAAWARTSALAKAAMSRADFERELEQLPHADVDRPPELHLAFALPMGRFLPGANMVAWAPRATAVGPIVEVVVLRLDDDIEWRVVGVAGWSARRESSPTVRQGSSAAANGVHVL